MPAFSDDTHVDDEPHGIDCLCPDCVDYWNVAMSNRKVEEHPVGCRCSLHRGGRTQLPWGEEKRDPIGSDDWHAHWFGYIEVPVDESLL